MDVHAPVTERVSPLIWTYPLKSSLWEANQVSDNIARKHWTEKLHEKAVLLNDMKVSWT